MFVYMHGELGKLRELRENDHIVGVVSSIGQFISKY